MELHWIDKNDTFIKDFFIHSVNYVEGLEYNNSYSQIFNKISLSPTIKNSKELSQYFTPADVSLYSSYNLLKNFNKNDKKNIVFDPSAGNGSLLISAALILAYKFNLRDEALLTRIHGCEISHETRCVCISNIIESLTEFLQNISPLDARKILNQNIVHGDFLDFSFNNNYKYNIITNPPYQENKSHKIKNIWIQFADKIISEKNVIAFSAILPVSISCADRTKNIRSKIISKYNDITTFHHETRPRPLFKNVEQRITIITAKNSISPKFLTTGFLMHKSKERLSIWAQEYSKLTKLDYENIFPKPMPNDIDFMRERIRTSKKIIDLNGGEMVDFWVRTTGRYKLNIQKEAPENKTTKWINKKTPSEQFEFILSEFNNGNALKWWRIFGDGRDLSLNKFINNYGVK